MEKGNKFWQRRAKHGRDKIFESNEILWETACDYFQWVEDNPLWETKVVQYQGVPINLDAPKMRAMTISGFCSYCEIGDSTWYDYKVRHDFSAVCEKIEAVIKTQKFEGASAGLLNPAIIARDLGLADKREVDLTGNLKSEIKQITKEMSAEEAADIYKSLCSGGD